jgi:class 3 adenylate cyclase
MADAKRAKGAYWGNLFIAEQVGLPFINIRIPLRRDGRYLGTLIAGVSIGQLSQFLDAFSDQYINAFVLSEREFVLAHPLLQDGFPGLSDQHLLPHLSEFGDIVLRQIWSTSRDLQMEARLSNGVEARVIEYLDETYVFLFRSLAGYGREPWLLGTYIQLESVAGQFGRLDLYLWIGLGVLSLALIFAVLLGRAFGRPIRRLARAAGYVRNLQLDDVPTLPRGWFRELNEAITAFNAMVGAMRSFVTYVPRSLVLRLVDESDGLQEMVSEERKVTVLFSDIVGFTSLAESLPATEVAEFLNHHFSLVGSCVEAEAGTIDKYMGDAMMAFWGAPEQMTDHAERACRAALEIARSIRSDNVVRRGAGLLPVRIRMGIHSGPVVVGNIGATTRINYTIIGDAVNMAERLEELARELGDVASDVNIILSAETAEKLGGDFSLLEMGSQVLRGRHEPTRIFGLVIPDEASG